jgi:hypothetical protein
VWLEALGVETVGELPLQRRPQINAGRTLGVRRARLLRLVLLDHDEPVVSRTRGVELNAWFVVGPNECLLEGCDHLGVVLGDGKGRDDEDNAHVRGLPCRRGSSLPWRAVI